MTQITLPEIGDGIESGDVLEIFVSVGDVITKGQDIIELETDKATVPVPASTSGKVTKILVGEGDTVPIGGAILEVEAESEAESAEPPPSQPAPPQQDEGKQAADSQTTAQQPDDPQGGDLEGDAEGKDQADAGAPQSNEPVAARSGAETPSEEEEPAAPAAAQAGRGEPAPTQAAEPAARSPQPGTSGQQAPASEAAPEPAAAGTQTVIPAGPAVRRFAREVGVDLSRVTGTGDEGRITREDVLAVVRSAGKAPAAPAAAEQPSEARRAGAESDRPGTPGSDDYGPTRTEAMSKIRKTIARQMHASWTTIPRVTNFDDADISDLEKLRQSSKEDYAAQGLKLTTMPFLIKAVATALRHNPMINAVIDMENEQIIYKDYVNVGIAVDTDRGLVVPVMHNADRKGVPEITRSLAEMASKVRGGKFSLADIRGGTFSISNLGAIGGQYSTPVVNLPEVAILLVGRSRKLPVVMPDDTIQPRLMMPLSISYDHRLVDGATAARFLNDVIGYLEAPSRLLLAL